MGQIIILGSTFHPDTVYISRRFAGSKMKVC